MIITRVRPTRRSSDLGRSNTRNKGADDLGTEQGGSGCPDIGTDLIGGDAIGNDIWVRDMGPDATHE